MIVEEVVIQMDERDYTYMNDGRETRINTTTDTELALHITLGSNSLAGLSSWEV